jgi:hypothetical protein
MKQRLFFALSALVLVVAVGCGPSKADLVKFNDSLTKANKRLNSAGQVYATALMKAMTSGKGNNPEMRQQHEAVVKVFEQVKTEVDAVQVPKAKGAQELYNAMQKFLQFEEEAIRKDFKQVADILNSGTVDLTAAQRIQQILQSVAKREETELNALKNAQREFANAHGIILLNTP